MKKRSGFTLIELLVVVAVIALLIAILLPSLGRARKQANTTRCLANIRGLNTSTKLYVTEYARTMMGGGHGGLLKAWDSQLLGQGMYVPPGTTLWDYYNLKNGRGDSSDKLRYCPETVTAANPNPPDPGVGSANLQWNCGGGSTNATTGSYGWNGWCFDPSDGAAGSNCGSDWSTTTKYKLYSAKNESEIPTFADATYHDFWPDETDAIPPNVENPGPTTVGIRVNQMGDDTMWRVSLNRHNKAVNVTFWDGHAETVKLGDLWILKWSASWYRANPARIQ